jgi:hypothetical protein
MSFSKTSFSKNPGGKWRAAAENAKRIGAKGTGALIKYA